MTPLFKDWLFNKFPHRYKKEDSYKDVDGKGLFERFLNALGEELDEEVIPYLESHLDILDSMSVSDALLPHLADTLGNPPDTLRDADKYRLFLKYIVPINRLKGTVGSYDLLFSIFGVTVEIEVDELVRHLYDNDLEYDEKDGDLLYDSDCPECICYSLNIIDGDGNFPLFGEMNEAELENLLKLIGYIEPIDTLLCTLSYNGSEIYSTIPN